MKPGLKQLIEEACSIIDLKERLKEYGHDFKTYKEYLRFLDKEWKKTQKSIDDILNPQIKNYDDLPTLEVESDGITYLIHGIAHGQEITGWNPRKIRKSISTKMNSYHNPEKGEDYLYEEKFREHFFDLLESQELTDITSTESQPTLAQKIISYTLLPLTIPLVITTYVPGWILANLFSTGLYLRYRFMKNPKSEKFKFHLALEALSDVKQQVKYAETSIAPQMPQPLQLEMEYVHDKESFANRILSYLIPSQRIATSGERSLWTVKELVKYAKSNNLKRLHYLGGIGHLTEIANFLKNPDYSFEKLKNYKTSRK